MADDAIVQKHEGMAKQLADIADEWRGARDVAPNAAAYVAACALVDGCERAALAHLDIAQALQAMDEHLTDPDPSDSERTDR